MTQVCETFTQIVPASFYAGNELEDEGKFIEEVYDPSEPLQSPSYLFSDSSDSGESAPV